MRFVKTVFLFLQHSLASVRSEVKSHHLYIGAGGLVAIGCIGLVLLIPGRTKKLRADVPAVIEIQSPSASSASVALPPLQGIGSSLASDLPKSELVESPCVGITAFDGIPLGVSGSGLFKRAGVALTSNLAAFSQNLSRYFASHHMEAMITSGVRTSDHQLDIIKERIAEYGMSASFPALPSATVSNKQSWTPAWEWLKAHHVPVNPPVDYVNEDGNVIGGSLHLKGLAMDLVADDLDALRDALVASANAGVEGGGLRIAALTRERDCVHISLSH